MQYKFMFVDNINCKWYSPKGSLIQEKQMAEDLPLNFKDDIRIQVKTGLKARESGDVARQLVELFEEKGLNEDQRVEAVKQALRCFKNNVEPTVYLLLGFVASYRDRKFKQLSNHEVPKDISQLLDGVKFIFKSRFQISAFTLDKLQKFVSQTSYLSEEEKVEWRQDIESAIDNLS